MTLVLKLVGFGLRHAVGELAGGVGAEVAVGAIGILRTHLTDHSQSLPKALARANDRAWKALAVALAGDGLLDRAKLLLADGDDKGLREQVRPFLAGAAAHYGAAPADLRKACLAELKQARKNGDLSAENLAPDEVAQQAAGFRRYADAKGMVDSAHDAVGRVADDMSGRYPNLAALLRRPTPAGPPLLAAAFAYFFRREIETDDELSNALTYDGLRQLSASQAKAFGDVGKALNTLGAQFDEALQEVVERLERIEDVAVETRDAAVETHASVLDLGGDVRRMSEALGQLTAQVASMQARAGMSGRGEVRPRHSLSIRTGDERRAVQAMLERFRQLPAEQQRQAPALLNALGKLQVGAGDFEGARETFAEVAAAVDDGPAKAEAHYNAYRAALEQGRWDDALAAVRQAAALDEDRFAPFPLNRYQPKRVLGAGGFGTAFLCHDSYFGTDVVIKCLHAADLDRGVDQVFAEARVLRSLRHAAIIEVLDCDYAGTDADGGKPARPYLVMDYFAGQNLGEYLKQHGALPVPDVLDVSRQVAAAMKAAHDRGVLHRDLKPENVLVRKAAQGGAWEVRLIDFGLALRRDNVETAAAAGSSTGARSILSDSVAGTVKYAPPEQMGELPGVAPGPYSDVYAFGKLCCQALFGTAEPRRRHWSAVPEKLAEMLEKCIEHEPKLRHPDFGPVLAALATAAVAPASAAAATPAGPDPVSRRVEADATEAVRVARGGGTITAYVTRAAPQRIAEWKQAAAAGQREGMWLLAHAHLVGAAVAADDAAALGLLRKAADAGHVASLWTWAWMVFNGRGVPADEAEAARLYRRAAEAGDVSGMYSYGWALSEGRGVTKDEAAAVKWLRKAAEAGDVDAMTLLGIMYDHGRGVAKDGAEAVRWYRPAAEAGNATAMFNLGASYTAGSGGLANDQSQATAWFRKSAEAGDADAMNQVGDAYREGHGVARDEAEALRWYHKAADAGNTAAKFRLISLRPSKSDKEGAAATPKDDPDAATARLRKSAEAGDTKAMDELAQAYRAGTGVPQDHAEALNWFRRAAAAGSTSAMVNAGYSYYKGLGVQRDGAEAVKWFRKAAEAGDAAGMANLGWSYVEGWSTAGSGAAEQDLAEAMKWLRKAADAGNADAMANLSTLYANGMGVAKDEGESLKWLRRSAEGGQPKAMNLLGNRYRVGAGVPKDEAQAVHWYRRAADAGSAAAMSSFGVMQERGMGGLKADAAEAVKWYRRAADAGDAVAMHNLAGMYARGDGVGKNEAQAAQWYRNAAAAGDTDAMVFVGRMYADGTYGTPKDPKQAAPWLEKAAKLGHREGMYRLAALYFSNAIAAESNDDEAKGAEWKRAAAQWYRKAAEAGHVEAMYMLGLWSAAATGMAKDDAEAVKWFRKAASAGNRAAREALARRGIKE